MWIERVERARELIGPAHVIFGAWVGNFQIDWKRRYIYINAVYAMCSMCAYGREYPTTTSSHSRRIYRPRYVFIIVHDFWLCNYNSLVVTSFRYTVYGKAMICAEFCVYGASVFFFIFSFCVLNEYYVQWTRFARFLTKNFPDGQVICSKFTKFNMNWMPKLNWNKIN